MDRQIVYPGSIPLDTDLLNVQRSVMIALGYLAQATLGTGTVVDGLACVPTSPASMSVIVGPGSITQLTAVDANGFGSLGADAIDPLLKMGVNITGTSFTLVAPSSSGQVINYLLQASFSETDGTPLVLPYYNAATPALAFSGPNNTGSAQNTQRLQRVQVLLKAGTAAAAGAQTTPAVDTGCVGLYVISVGYGQSAISAGNISKVTGAPFLNYKLPQLTPGYRNMATFAAGQSGSWSPPQGVTAVKLRVWGAGGGGGAGNGGVGGGGAGGGFNEGYYAVTPGQAYVVTVGNGGPGPGGAGGSSSFGNLASGSGGGGGGNGGAGTGGLGSVAPGTGYGTGFSVSGSGGQGGTTAAGSWLTGQGGGAFGSGGAVGVVGASGSNASGNAGVGRGRLWGYRRRRRRPGWPRPHHRGVVGMRTYARVEGSRVAEVVQTDAAIERLYHPSMAWVDVTGVSGLAEGWHYEGGAARAPEVQAPTATAVVPNLDDLKARIDALHAEVALLAGAAES